MANYQINNIINDVINNDNININANIPIYNGPNCSYTIYELLEQVRISLDINRMKMYILTTIDWNMYNNSNDQANYIAYYVVQLSNRVNQINNMIFSNNDNYILSMILNIIDNCTNYQKKLIYNMFSSL
jgi:hypothetical protein